MDFIKDLKTNKDELLKLFNNNEDIKHRDISLKSGVMCTFIFLENAVEPDCVRDILKRLMDADRVTKDIPKYLKLNVINTFGVDEVKNTEEAIRSILDGNGVLLVDGFDEALTIGCAQWNTRAITEPPTSALLLGPREGFTEDIKTNISLLRRRLHSPNFVYEKHTVGRYSNTEVAVCYIKGVADDNIVQKISQRLKQIDIDGIVDSYYIAQFLSEKPNSLFRTVGVAEKPDIIMSKILEGRVAIIVNGSPIVLTIPFLFFEDIQEGGDYYIKPARATFLRFLRLLGILLGVQLPGIYVALRIYHYMAMPIDYLTTILDSSQGVPFSPMYEMLFVILLFEIIHEASLRMPRYVGMAMSIVGALVLGDTAVKAGLLSSPTVMFVSISAISLYMIPNQVGIFHLFRLMFTIAGGIGGFLGIILLEFVLLAYMASLDSYGTPYLAPYAPKVYNDLGDALVMTDITRNTMRPYSFPNKNKRRLKINEENN
ncbi:MAG TPA: spore germination protein [Clostridia bacterium]